MQSRAPLIAALFIALACSVSINAGEDTIVNPGGELVRTDSAGITTDHPPGSSVIPLVSSDTADSGLAVERVSATNPQTGATIDAQGGVNGDSDSSGTAISTSGGAPAPAQAFGTIASSSVTRVTIDQMNFGVTYSDSYSLSRGFVVFGKAKHYYLSDGSDWRSGAGSFSRVRVVFQRAEVSGTTIRYYFHPPAEGYIYQQTDYNSGDHSSNGSLAVVGPIVLEAELGSDVATITGEVEILSNSPANYSDSRFNYWSAPPGAIAPFEATYTLQGGAVYDEETFNQNQDIANDGTVNFAESRRLPLQGLELRGSRQVPFGRPIQYYAVAIYENEATEDVSGSASWSVTPTQLATVTGGELIVPESGCDNTELTLSAVFTIDGQTREDSLTLGCVDPAAVGDDELWDTYQANERHTGYFPVSLDPEDFEFRWRKHLSPGHDLTPATAADGKVFVSTHRWYEGGESMFALDARDGHVLWSKDFGEETKIVNPPAYGYGNVYLQVDYRSDDPDLLAFDADTGEGIFSSAFASQSERYFAPTIYDGTVYAAGGYYGGMYSFNAFTGRNNWFIDLPQYDEFTPAVDEDYVYAYVGEGEPGLYVVDRRTGALAFMIPDPGFDWRGWSMDLAPVLGSQNDVLAIHNNRLIKFDLDDRSIEFELTDEFIGQPALAGDIIYAINRGGVEARSETDGALIWRWQPASGAAQEHVIVTDTHVLARTETHTFAIDVLTGLQDWSYPEAGSMSLGNDALYIAADEYLIAIATPGYLPAPIERLEISGPGNLTEFSQTRYKAIAHYSDGRERDRSSISHWELVPEDAASVDLDGVVSLGELASPMEAFQLIARYEEDGIEVEGTRSIVAKIGVTNDEFVTRNVRSANEAKRLAIAALMEAERREKAAIAVTKEAMHTDDANILNRLAAELDRLRRILLHTIYARYFAEKSLEISESEEE